MENDLTPADAKDLTFSIRLALTLDTRGRPKKWKPPTDDVSAQIAAERVVEALRTAGYVVMRKPPAKPHTSWGSNMVD